MPHDTACRVARREPLGLGGSLTLLLVYLPPQDVMRPPGAQAFTDLYVVYELADTDLHQVIRSNQPLSGAIACP